MPLEFPEASRRQLAICSQAPGRGLVSGGSLRATNTEMVFKVMGKTAVGRMGVESQGTLPHKHLHFPRAHPSTRAGGSSVVQSKSKRSHPLTLGQGMPSSQAPSLFRRKNLVPDTRGPWTTYLGRWYRQPSTPHLMRVWMLWMERPRGQLHVGVQNPWWV